MAQACLASPALGGAGLRPPPAVGRRRGSGAAVGSRARCARQPGARRAPAPSHSSEKNVHHPRGIWVSCGAARDPGDGDDEDGPSTSEPRMAPPTPSPVFSRRPLSARQRKVLNERVLARPPPGLGGGNVGAPGSGLSLQASRQQAELFKGLTQQLSGLSALGLGNVPALEQWRKSSNQTAKPDGKVGGRTGPRRCGCCGELGHNKRSCPVAFQRDVDALTGKLTGGATDVEAIGYLQSGGAPAPEVRDKVRTERPLSEDDVDLEEYFEDKYRDFYERKMTPHPPRRGGSYRTNRGDPPGSNRPPRSSVSPRMNPKPGDDPAAGPSSTLGSYSPRRMPGLDARSAQRRAACAGPRTTTSVGTM